MTSSCCFFFFFNAPAPTEIYTLSLHELFRSYPSPRRRTSRLCCRDLGRPAANEPEAAAAVPAAHPPGADRKSTRLNSSHTVISYDVFCLKKKKPSSTLRHISQPRDSPSGPQT